MNRLQIVLFALVAALSFGGSSSLSAQSQAKPKNATPALSKSLQDVYLYWRKSIVEKNYKSWSFITAYHRKAVVQNRIMSEKGKFPEQIFRLPSAPPALTGLKLIRSRSLGVTAKLVYFGKVDFGVGGQPSDNLLVLSFLHEGKGWKYDTAEFINLSSLKDIRSQLQAGNLSYVDGQAFLPDGKRPVPQTIVKKAKYIAKVYTYCPGREVRATVNKISKHRFQDTTQSEVVIGGLRDGINEINYTIKDLPGYKGDDPMTVRVYLFSQIDGVMPIKVFQYQTAKGEKPKLKGSAMFNVDAASGAKVLGK